MCNQALDVHVIIDCQMSNTSNKKRFKFKSLTRNYNTCSIAIINFSVYPYNCYLFFRNAVYSVSICVSPVE